MTPVRKQLQELERKLDAKLRSHPFYYRDPSTASDPLERRLLEGAAKSARYRRIQYALMARELQYQGRHELAAACRRGVDPPPGITISRERQESLRRVTRSLLQALGLTPLREDVPESDDIAADESSAPSTDGTESAPTPSCREDVPPPVSSTPGT